MFTTDDYKNLAVLLSRVTFNGIQEAAAGVALFSKLQQAATGPAEDKASNGDQSADGSK